MDLAGTSAVVVGASAGLGYATAASLSSRGVKVVLVARDPERGRRAAESLGGAFVTGDVTDSSVIIEALDRASEMAPLRSLVVTAGRGYAHRTIGRDGRYESAHELDPLREVLETNVVGTFNCVRLAASAMSRTDPDENGQRGAMVLTSSAAAKAAQVGQVAYAASKAAVLGMILPIARDLAPVGVRVNAIVPGGFDTEIFGPSGPSDELRSLVGGATVFPHRMGKPHEFASLAVELLSNDYLNATSVDLDAGTRVLPKKKSSER